MMWMSSAIAVTLIGLELASAVAQDLGAQIAALKEIREAAADICYTVEQRGRKSEAQLTGEVQAKVTGIFAKLAALGVKGSGQIGSTEYQGISQEALGAAFTASINCRERVSDKLIDRMLPSARAGAAVRQPDPTPQPPVSMPPTPNAKKVSVGAFAIGDSIEQVRASGIQGEFGVSEDGHTQFTMPIAVPINYLNKNGWATYRFNNKTIDKITVLILDESSCDSVDFQNINWTNFLLSQTIQELGEPAEPPSQYKEVFPIGDQLFSGNVTKYVFSGKGEVREVEIADATGANNWSQKICVFVSRHVRGD